MKSLWFKHDAHFHEHPKCLRLRRLAGTKADSAEVGWWRVIAAGRRIGSWTFADEEHLADATGRYYRFVPLYRSVGLLDGLTIHDAEAYQGAMSGAERVAAHRATRNAQAVTDVTPREDKSREEREEQIPRDAADVYWQLTGKFPTGRALDWIDNLSATYGGEASIRALVKAQSSDPSAKDLLSRTQDLLRADARKLDLREREAEQARLAEKRAQPRVEEPWRAELRDAIRKQYEGLDAA